MNGIELKFGGTSLESPKRMKHVAGLVKEQAEKIQETGEMWVVQLRFRELPTPSMTIWSLTYPSKNLEVEEKKPDNKKKGKKNRNSETDEVAKERGHFNTNLLSN